MLVGLANIVKTHRLASLLVMGVFSFLTIHGFVRAADTTDLSQTINAGTLDVQIVDSNGDAVGSPSVAFNTITFAFDNTTTTGSLGAAEELVRLLNPTGTATWSVTLAATSGATTRWTDGGSNEIDFNDSTWSGDGGDADDDEGVLYVKPQTGSIDGVAGCATTNVSLGSNTAFNQGTVDSITLFSAASGAATYCRFDLTGVDLDQLIPGGTPAATYTINMTLTAS